MTDHELQLKAVALRRAAAGPAFQPERLMEYSPGLRGALPWVCVPQNSLHPEGVREPFAQSTPLAPLQGATHFGSLTQGSSRYAQTTLGCIPVALQATNQVALRRAALVASAILADVEPGFQPGGKKRRVSEAVRQGRAHLKSVRLSGRQDAALYGRQGCPPLQPRCPDSPHACCFHVN